MLLTFATTDDVFADYAAVMVWGALIVVVTIITLGAANKDSPSAVRTSTAVQIGCFAYLLLAIASYRETYGSFIEADISADGARLSFAGALYHPAVLKREEIKEVIFGFPGKGKPHRCYLKFITTSGASYRSAATEGTSCKDQREQIYALIKR